MRDALVTSRPHIGVKFKVETNKMKCYIVLWKCSVIGVFSSPVYSAEVAKTLEESTVVAVQLNSYSDVGKQLVCDMNPSMEGFTP